MTISTAKLPPKSTAPMRSALAEKAHQEANASFFKPENPGDSIEGHVVEVQTGRGQFNSVHYKLRLDDYTVRIVSASPGSVLGGKLEGQHVAAGDRLYVEYLGEKRSKQGTRYKDWAIACEKPQPAPAQSAPDLCDDHIPPY